jgi:hypothetical protein
MLKKSVEILLYAFALISVLFFARFLPFVGCAPEIRTANYLEIYSDFLNYSLGDYVVISERIDEHYPNMSNSPITYTEWTLQYKRYDGEVTRFSFNNYGIDDIHNMGEAVIWEAGSMWFERIKQDVISHYFAPESMDPFAHFTREKTDSTHTTTLTKLKIFPQFRIDSAARNFADILNSQSGLQLYSITLPELLTKWDIVFKIDISTLDAENHLDILERFKVMIRTLSEYAGHDRIEVSFSAIGVAGINEGTSFSGYYDKQADAFIVK